MIKHLVLSWFFVLFFCSFALAQGFNGFLDVDRVTEISSDTFQIRGAFTGNPYTDTLGQQGVYITDSLKVGDKMWVNCREYDIVSVDTITDPLAVFTVILPDTITQLVSPFRSALYRPSDIWSLIGYVMTDNTFGLDVPEATCMFANFVGQVDSIRTIGDSTLVGTGVPGDTLSVSTSWSIQGDTGSPETVINEDIVTITGGIGITTQSIPTDQVVVDVDGSEFNTETSILASHYFLLWDSGDGSEDRVADDLIQEWIIDSLGASVIVGGTDIDAIYDDGAGTITINYTGAGGGMTSFNWGSYEDLTSTVTAISQGETIRIDVGTDNGLDAVLSGNDVQLDLSFGELDVELAGDNTDYFVLWDSNGDREEIMADEYMEEFIEDRVGGMLGGTQTGISVTYTDGGVGAGVLNFVATDQSTTNEAWTITADNAVSEVISNETVDFVGGTNVTTSYNSTTKELTINSSASGMTSWLAGRKEDGASSTQTITNGEARYLDVGTNSGLDLSITTSDWDLSLDFLEFGSAVNVSKTDDYFVAVSSVGTEKRFLSTEILDLVGGMVSGNSESGITVTYQSSDQTLDFSATDNSATNEGWTISDGTTTEFLTTSDGDVIFSGAGGITTSYNTLNNTMTITGSGTGMTSWNLDADEGTSSAITNGETVTLSGTGLSFTGAGDSKTLIYDFDELNPQTLLDPDADLIVLHDQSANSYETMTTGDLVQQSLDRGYGGHTVEVARNADIDGTWEKINLTTAGTMGTMVTNNFTNTSANRITYNGSGSHVFLIQASLSGVFDGGDKNKDMEVGIAISGTVDTDSKQFVNHGFDAADGGHTFQVSIMLLKSLSTNQYIEVFARGVSGSIDIGVTWPQITLTVVEIY